MAKTMTTWDVTLVRYTRDDKGRIVSTEYKDDVVIEAYDWRYLLTSIESLHPGWAYYEAHPRTNGEMPYRMTVPVTVTLTVRAECPADAVSDAESAVEELFLDEDGLHPFGWDVEFGEVTISE